MMEQSYQLLIFDWDGTLMDSEARIVACAQAAAQDISIEVPTDASVRNIIGLGLKEAFDVLFPEHDEKTMARFVEQYRHHFLHVDETPSALFAGVQHMLDCLQEMDFLLAIATGKGRPGLNLVLEETQLGSYFQATRTADETFSKPNPEMLYQILNELGIEAQNALMIGDTEYDLQMASNARMPSLAVSYGVHEVERLKRHNPVACVDDIEQMKRWLTGESTR